ncbi:hypothetical protein BH10ACT6_BH10ACT6_00240 [soil metagenome]
MWPRMLALAIFVALPLCGIPSAGAAQQLGGRGHTASAGGVASIRGSWSWPVAPPHRLARSFVAPPTPYAAGHRGIDIRAAGGSPVLAPDDGIVHFAGVVVDRPVLSIADSDGVLSSFEPVSSTLATGDPVRRGEVIGTLLAGHCATPCLHLGARVDGEYVNPLLFLGGVPWSVLLPAG